MILAKARADLAAELMDDYEKQFQATDAQTPESTEDMVAQFMEQLIRKWLDDFCSTTSGQVDYRLAFTLNEEQQTATLTLVNVELGSSQVLYAKTAQAQVVQLARRTLMLDLIRELTITGFLYATAVKRGRTIEPPKTFTEHLKKKTAMNNLKKGIEKAKQELNKNK